MTLERVAAGLPAETRSEIESARLRLRTRAEETARLSLRTAHLVRALARAFDGLFGGGTYGPAGQPRPLAPGPIIDARG